MAGQWAAVPLTIPKEQRGASVQIDKEVTDDVARHMEDRRLSK